MHSVYFFAVFVFRRPDLSRRLCELVLTERRFCPPRMSANSSEKSNPKNCLTFEFNSGIIRLWPTVESSSTTRSANCPICDFFPALGGSCERNRACSRERIPLRVRQGSKRPAPFETPRDNQGFPRQSLLPLYNLARLFP